MAPTLGLLLVVVAAPAPVPVPVLALALVLVVVVEVLVLVLVPMCQIPVEYHQASFVIIRHLRCLIRTAVILAAVGMERQVKP